MGKHLFYDAEWVIKLIRNGQVIWEDVGKNALADQGEEAILESFFRGDATYTPTQFYVRLCNDTLTETDVLSSVLNEPSGNGYSAQLLERSTTGFPTKELHDGDYRIVSKELTFTASGGQIGPVITAYLATTSDNSGILLAYRSLSMTRTILDGDSMTVQMRIKLK